MPVPIPAPTDLVERYVTAAEAVPFTAPDGTTVFLDAHTPNNLETARARVSAAIQFELYLRIGILGAELMPDTAVDWLPRHGAIWRTPRLGPAPSIGNLVVSGPAGLQILTGTEFAVAGTAGIRWISTATVTIAAGAGSVSVPVQSETNGAATVLAAGTALQPVTPIPTATSIVVDPSGLEGGADLEDPDSWRARILQAIRSPASGGSAADYVKWARAAGAPYVNVIRGWMGDGTVGVIVAMPGPRVPTPSEVAAIQAYIDGVRPVRGNVTVAAATLLPIAPTIGLNPDNAVQRGLVTQAVAAWFLATAQVGGTVYESQLSDAISAVGGEVSHLLYQPAADVVLQPTQIAVFAPINWGAPG